MPTADSPSPIDPLRIEARATDFVVRIAFLGGTLTHGLIGLFLGPIVLAVFYDLVVAWTRLGAAGAASGAA